MITIEDNDMPIVVASKLIEGTRPCDTPPSIQEMLGDEYSGQCDMFTLNELKEIAVYLLVYYEAHKEEST